MTHEYILIGRRGNAIFLEEKSVMSLLFADEIRYDHTGHIGKDTTMRHYFKFKD